MKTMHSLICLICGLSLLTSCTHRHNPMLHYNNPVVYETKSKKGDISIGATYGSDALGSASGNNPKYWHTFGFYQISDYVYSGASFAYASLDGHSSLNATTGYIGLQYARGLFYTRNSFGFTYGHIDTYSMLSGDINRYQVKSMVGLQYKTVELSYTLRYYSQKYKNIQGEFIVDRTHVDTYLKSIPVVETLDHTLTASFKYSIGSFFLQLSGPNELRKKRKYFFDDATYVGAGFNINLNVLGNKDKE